MKKIIEYQKLDLELNKLKRSSLKNEDRNNLTKLKGYIVEYQGKGIQLENDAKALLEEYTKLKSQYEANGKKVQKLLDTDISSITLEEIDNYFSTLNSLSNELFMLERNIDIIITKINTSLKNFDTTKKNIIKAKEKFKECKEKCEKDTLAVAPKIKAIEEKMKVLESEIDAGLLAKYKTIKNDKIFPVFVENNDGHCNGCMVEIPTSKLNKLKNDGTIVCEQCHRIIFNK